MTPLTLTEKERQVFAAWLVQEAAVNDMMITQMEKLKDMGAAIAMYKADAAAYRRVAKVLQETHTETV